MNVSGNPGAIAAQQLMQATSQAVQMSMRQLNAVNNSLTDTKAKALEISAQQETAAADRKSHEIDLMA